MKNIPIAMKIILNFIFFVIYWLISMNLVNFIYDLILNFSWRSVPPPNDPIHLKIAWTVLLFVLILTIIFRKYFYLNVLKEKKIKSGKVEKKDNKNTEFIDK